MPLGGPQNFLFRFLTKAIVRGNILLRPIERSSKASRPLPFSVPTRFVLANGKHLIKRQSV